MNAPRLPEPAARPQAGGIVGRLAPSPTGRLHLGNAFAFLAAWLSARSQGGLVLLRMEDIDPDRSRQEFARAILEDLHWLGLDWDYGPDKGGPHAPYEQSHRLERYAALLAQLEARGLTYPCYCTRKELRSLASAPHVGDEGAPYPGLCRSLGAAEREALEKQGRRACVRLDTAAALHDGSGPVWRDTSSGVFFDDAVLGPQRISLKDCGGDFALKRSDGVVAYQLAVAADDADMGVSEVVRGDDLLLSAPRQILLFGLMGRQPPRYAHVPLLHDAAGERLAKRHKSLELAALRAAGVRPEALCGWLAHCAGWRGRYEAARPHDLLASFTFTTLGQRFLRLPENCIDLLLRL